MTSKDLKKYELMALQKIADELAGEGYSETKPRTVFSDVDYDGVYMNGNKVVIVEVALGGGTDALKAGPERKMKTDVLKLTSSEVFIKDTNNKVERRILIVRKGIESKINKGWLSKIISSSNKIEVIEHDFGSDETEINQIRASCIYEKADDNICSD